MSAHDNVFGVGHKLHPITKLPLESGIGCLSERLQAFGRHLQVIAHEQGQEAATAMHKRLEEHYAPPEPEPETKVEE